MTIMTTGGHCCVCTVVCMHIGGPYLCDEHKQPAPVSTTPVTPTYEPLPAFGGLNAAERDQYRAERDQARAELAEYKSRAVASYEAKVQDFAAETLRSSQLAAEVAALRRQLDEARRIIRNANLAIIRENTTAAAVALAMFDTRDNGGPSVLDRLAAAEADRDRLLVVYRATEALVAALEAMQILLPRQGGKTRLHEAYTAARTTLDSYRSAAPAEPAPGDVGGVPVDTEEAPA